MLYIQLVSAGDNMVLQKENETLSSSIFRWAFEFEDKLVRKDNKTIQNYINVVKNFEKFISSSSRYDNLKYENINSDLLDRYFYFRDNNHKLKTGRILKTSTKQNDKKVLKIFFEFIEDKNNEKFEFNIKWRKIDIGKIKRVERDYFNEDALNDIIKYLEKNIKKNRKEFDYMLSFTFKLALFGGLRASEICSVRLKHFGKPYVSKSNGKKFISLLILGKGDTEFTNPIRYDYIKNEYNYFKRNRNEKDLLFKSIRGKNLNRIHLYDYFKKISDELNLGKKGVHIVRRTFATRLNEFGVDIRNIQLLMRHTDIKTTAIYTARSQKQMEDAAGVL